MIESKEELREYLCRDMAFYYTQSKRERIICALTQDPAYRIAQYIRFLRKEEYYYNVRKDLTGKVAYLYWLSRKNRLGNMLGFKIPHNCIGPGLTIYHHGGIIINEEARIGADCKLHGSNCIGNKGAGGSAPVVGDGLDLGVGACIIGDVTLGDQVKIGANAVVNRSFMGSNITLVGVPAKDVKATCVTDTKQA